MIANEFSLLSFLSPQDLVFIPYHPFPLYSFFFLFPLLTSFTHWEDGVKPVKLGPFIPLREVVSEGPTMGTSLKINKRQLTKCNDIC